MALLDKAKLLEKEVLQIEKVDLGNDEFVFVRQMTGRERDRFERSMLKPVKDRQGNIMKYAQNIDDFRAKLVVNVICDEAGNNLLDPGDFEALSKNMSAAKLEKLVDVAQKLNKISEADKEALTKNSEGDQSEEDISQPVAD